MVDFARVAADGCGLMFVLAALGKFDGWSEWASFARAFPGPQIGRETLRITLPVVEAVVAALAFGDPRLGLPVAAGVLAALAVGVLVFGRFLRGQECNCFGVAAPSRIGPSLAIRNVAFAVVATAGAYAAATSALGPIPGSQILATALAGVVLLIAFELRRFGERARGRAVD